MQMAALPLSSAAALAKISSDCPVHRPPARRRPICCAARDFDVIEGIDLSRDEMFQRLREFGDKAKGADIAVFYHSGQGIFVDGSEFLHATDADIRIVVKLGNAFDTDLAIDQTMSEVKTTLVFPDFSHSNPFPALRRRNRDAFRPERTLRK
jgi:hypothetical protein